MSAQQAQKDLISENESLLGDLEERQVALEEVQVKHSQLEGRNAQLLADFADVTRVTETQRQAAESARTELAKLQLRLEGVPPLEAELSRMHEAFEAERGARVAADQVAAVAEARLEQSRAFVDDLKIRLARTETDLREANQEAAKLRSQVSSLQGSLDSTGKELAHRGSTLHPDFRPFSESAFSTGAGLKAMIAKVLWWHVCNSHHQS